MQRAALVGLALALASAGCWSWDPPARQNLLPNPGCDDGTESWYAYQSTLSRATEQPRSGAGACRVAHAAGEDYSIVENRLPELSPGTRLQAAAWVRAAGAAGKIAGLSLRQRAAAGVVDEKKAEVALHADWRLLVSSYTVAAQGALELYVYQLDAQPGDAFEVDDVLLVVAPEEQP